MNQPRPYNLSDPADLDRLLRETIGYAKVSLHYGTDDVGRRHAAFGLEHAYRRGYRMVPPAARKCEPDVVTGDE